MSTVCAGEIQTDRSRSRFIFTFFVVSQFYLGFLIGHHPKKNVFLYFQKLAATPPPPGMI